MIKFNIIELFKLLRKIAYVLLLVALVKLGIYHLIVDIISKSLEPSERGLKKRGLVAERLTSLREGYKWHSEYDLDVFLKKYNEYFLKIDYRKHFKNNPFHPEQIKKLEKAYKKTRAMPEDLVVKTKLKLISRAKARSIFIADKKSVIATLKSNEYCKNFYIKNYPEVFDPAHRFDSIPSTIDEWFPIVNSFLNGLKLPSFYEYYYNLCIDPLIFSWAWNFIFWCVYPGGLFWQDKSLQLAFDFVNEIGFGARGGKYPKYQNLILEFFQGLFPNTYDYLEYVYTTFLTEDALDSYIARRTPPPPPPSTSRTLPGMSAMSSGESERTEEDSGNQ